MRVFVLTVIAVIAVIVATALGLLSNIIANKIQPHIEHRTRLLIVLFSSLVGISIVVAISLVQSPDAEVKKNGPPPPVFQETPNIRTTYLLMEGTTLLDRAIRGYGFSPEDGFTSKPFWLKNEVFKDLESILSTCNKAKASRNEGDFSAMSWYAGTGDGRELWSAEIDNNQVVKQSSKPTTPKSEPEKFHAGASPCRGPSFPGIFNIDEMLQRVETSSQWHINSNSDSEVVPFDQYEIFGLPESSEAVRHATDPLSLEILRRRPDLRDFVFMTVYFNHDGYQGIVWIREIKLLLLDIENVGDKPIGLSAIKRKIVRSSDPFSVRSSKENDRALASAEIDDSEINLELLRPNEHLFIPLQLQFGFATPLKDHPDYNYEAYVEESMLPSDWWRTRQGETIPLEILRSTSAQGIPNTDLYSLDKAVLQTKPRIRSLIESTYYAGNFVDVTDVVFRTGRGELSNWPVRRFNPNKLLAKGAYEFGSCPVLLAKSNERSDAWDRIGPVLVDSVTRAREDEVSVPIETMTTTFKITELESETTFLDEVRLRIVDSAGVTVDLFPEGIPLLRARDHEYLELPPKGQVTLHFNVASHLKTATSRQLILTGYYVPHSLLAK